ncbi:MAG: hypothetical protein KA020_02945 [Planctomycetes bacterium]|nr:hypothetical protein [Planctomycetota bacterium]
MTRFIAALARVLVLVTWTDAGRAIRTPFMRQWIVGSTLVSTGLWLALPWLQQRRAPIHFYLVDLGEIFVSLMMPAFVVLSMARRRDITVPRAGATAVVIGVLLLWFLILLPLGFSARYASFYRDVLYAPVPWLITVQYVFADAMLAWTVIGLFDRVTAHERRPFLSALSILLPIGSIVLIGTASEGLRPVFLGWPVTPQVVFSVVAAAAISLLWAGLVWESRADRQGTAA